MQRRVAGAYRAIQDEAWELCDRASGAKLGPQAYPTLSQAAQKRARLVALARQVSQECAANVQQRCDIRRAR